MTISRMDAPINRRQLESDQVGYYRCMARIARNGGDEETAKNHEASAKRAAQNAKEAKERMNKHLGR